MKRTPTPWTLARPGTDRSITVTFYAPDAPFIVRACNAHEALVAALEIGISAYAGSRENWEKMKKTLKLAKG